VQGAHNRSCLPAVELCLLLCSDVHGEQRVAAYIPRDPQFSGDRAVNILYLSALFGMEQTRKTTIDTPRFHIHVPNLHLVCIVIDVSSH
jgi:hypothetical protein